MNIDLSAYEVTVIPAIIAILFVLKKNNVPAKVLPTVSLVLGTLVCGAIGGWTVDSILTGVIIGGLAVGVHSGTKNSIEDYVLDKDEKKEK